MPPDIAMLSARVKGTVRVLGEFSKLREAEYSRSDYMQELRVGDSLTLCLGDSLGRQPYPKPDPKPAA